MLVCCLSNIQWYPNSFHASISTLEPIRMQLPMKFNILFRRCLSSAVKVVRTTLQNIHKSILGIAGGKKPGITQWSRCANTRQFKNAPHEPIISHYWHIAMLKLTARLPVALQCLVKRRSASQQGATIRTITPHPQPHARWVSLGLSGGGRARADTLQRPRCLPQPLFLRRHSLPR